MTADQCGPTRTLLTVDTHAAAHHLQTMR